MLAIKDDSVGRGLNTTGLDDGWSPTEQIRILIQHSVNIYVKHLAIFLKYIGKMVVQDNIKIHEPQYMPPKFNECKFLSRNASIYRT
jgi:hypothetical protein